MIDRSPSLTLDASGAEKILGGFAPSFDAKKFDSQSDSQTDGLERIWRHQADLNQQIFLQNERAASRGHRPRASAKSVEDRELLVRPPKVLCHQMEIAHRRRALRVPEHPRQKNDISRVL